MSLPKLGLAHVKGRSMEPTLHEGDRSWCCGVPPAPRADGRRAPPAVDSGARDRSRSSG